jgi:AcrR family transcriptional regulator
VTVSAPGPDRAARGSTRRPSGDGNIRGEATRQRIVDAAERLFAERGIAAVPLRDIGIEAGQKNHAAVQYHFGDRQQLVTAILEGRGGQSEASRADVVAGLLAGGVAPTVTDVVSAFVLPLAIHVRPANHYLAFLSHLITEQGGYEGVSEANTGSSVMTLRRLAGRLIPEVPEAVLEERWVVMETSAVHALARYQSAQRQRDRLPAAIDVLIDDLVAQLAAAMVAPVDARDPRRAGA